MLTKRNLWALLSVLVLVLLIAAQCQPAAPAAPPAAEEAPAAEEPATEEPAAEEPAEAPAEAAMHPALEDGKIVIAWIPKALNNPVFELGRDGAFVKAEELTAQGPYEVEVQYVGSVASDMAEQARVMEDMIAQGVDAIGVSCNDPDGCIDPINTAIDAGIEVMTWDSDAPDSERFTYLGVSNYDGGRAAADLLVRAMGEEGKVAMLTGVPGALNLEERMQGFQDEIAENYPGIEIVTTVAGYDDINQSVQVVEEAMQANPDLDGWFFVGLWPLFAERGSMPLWEAASESGQLTNVVFDTLPIELEYMKDGLVQGLVGQKYWGWGYDTVQMIYDKIVEGAEYDDWTDSGMDIVTMANVDAMIEAWETSDFTKPLPDPFAEAAEAPAEEMAELGEETLVFAMSADAGTLDPALETSANSLEPAYHIYEGLTDFETGTTTPIPVLATSWEASDDGLEWTFHLREGVTFHDGTPFDADAVIFNFERWWDTDNPYNLGSDQFLYWGYMFQGFKGEETSVLAGIEKVDDLTVKLILNRPNASLLNTLAMENFRFASPTAVMEQGDTYGTAEGLPVGTGPFMMEEWVKEDHITFVRYDDYWGEKPSLQRLTFRIIPDTSAAFLALQAGDIDMLSLWASPGPDDIAVALDDPNLEVAYNPAFNVGYLGLNHSKEWLQNENVRLAIAHAIDKQAIVDSFYPGDAEPGKEFQPPSLWGFNEAIEDYPYDPALAQEFLQAAIDEGVEIPDPIIFYVMPVSRAYYPQPQPTGELIQAFLAEIGLNAEIQSPAWPDPYISDITEDGTKHDLFMLGWVGDNGDPDNFLCTFFCGADTGWNNDGAGGGLPPDEEIAQMLRDAVAETDFETRKAMYEEINQLLHDRIIGVPIVHRTPPTLMRANIKGYIPSPVREVLTHIEKE